jgi:hypothetical protein
MTVYADDLVDVVGESYHQDVLRRVAARATGSDPFLEELAGHAREVAEKERDGKWFRVALIREPNNEYDENAIAVYANEVGLVGYLDRDDATEYQPVFKALKPHGCNVATCPAFLIGGTKSKPNYGVMLCLSTPKRIVAELAES